ncbi:tyrosine-type recombinase/integrase [Acidithiobacillus sp. VAN18-2]|nr:tyrosine-type recombinase/integrase [Igneacidithiobacillus copahuensis]MBU2795490.1 tyrosine-type recombinase/integrase [Acidithiobacillus sp. VAN18-2]
MGRHRSSHHHLPPRMHQKGPVYYYVVLVGGKRKWIRLADNYPEAVAKWAEMEGRNASGSTVGQAIDKYIATELAKLAESTRHEYIRQSGRLRSVFGHMPLNEVRGSDVAAYLDQHPSPVAANREMALFSTIFSFAIRWGWCDHNPAKGVRRNKEKPRDRYITDEEFSILREHADEQWRCIMDIAYLTAMRRGDIMKLRLSDIRPDALVISQGKTGKRMSFEMTPSLANALERAKRLRRRIGSLYVFCTRDGQPHSVSGWNSSWRRIVARSGVEDAHFHDIRAKALTDAKRAAGRDYAQSLAGHASGDMTEAYIRARETERITPLGKIVEERADCRKRSSDNSG